MRVRQREREWGSVAWDDRADIQPAIFAFGAFKKLIQITRAGSALVRGRGSWAKSKKTWKLDFLIFYAVITAFCGLKTHTHTHTRTQYKIHAKIHIYIKKIYILCMCVCVAYVLERYVLLLAVVAVVAVYRNTSLSIFICILEQV